MYMKGKPKYYDGVDLKRVNFLCSEKMWNEFGKQCKEANFGRSQYLRMCMQAFIDFDKKPMSDILEQTMINIIKNDKDFYKSIEDALNKKGNRDDD